MSGIFGPLEIVGGVAVGTGVGAAVARAVEPLVQEEANAAWRLNPVIPPDAVLMAQGVAQGQVTDSEARSWARDQGIGDSAFNALVQVANGGPGVAAALELWRRGLLDTAGFERAAKREGLEQEWINALVGLHDDLLSSAELAMMQQQGFIDAARANSEGALQGVTSERQQLRFEASGLPPGVETGLQMLRRGIIDANTFAQIVREGHTKTKYTAQLEQLLNVPMSVAAAVEGVIRERITPAEGRAAATQWGVSQATFDNLVEFGGRPPGIVQATTLVNRGVFTDADFRQVVARSNVRTEYADALLNLRFHYPPLFQLKRMVSDGEVLPATALDWLHKQGYLQPEWADVVTKWAGATTQAEKDLTKAEIVTLYEGRFLDATTTQNELKKLGYAALQITEIMSLADARRVIRFLNAALTKVHNQFVAFRIDEGRAVTELDQIGIASQARDDAIALWKIERDSNVQPVTRSEILRAAKAGVIGYATALSMLLAIGVPDQSARILISTLTKHTGASYELAAPLP